MNNKKLNIVMLVIVTLFACLFAYFGYTSSINFNLENTGDAVFGGMVDYPKQHAIFVDYLRNYFWETGNIFPDFGMEFGSGFNFSDLSYYGLMRPEVLLSYLFPQIPTDRWMGISYYGLYILGSVLLYVWLHIKTKNPIASFVGGMMYMTCFVLFFEAQRHPMFCNYLPWLILLLIALDKYKENTNYKYLIVASVYLLITSMYYYAVGSLIIAGLYVLLDSKDDFKSVIYRVGWMFAGVLVSAFFLFPTIINTIVNSRPSGADDLSVISLLVPDFSFKNILVSTIDKYSQSPQVTIIAVVAMIFLVFQKNKYIRSVGILTILLSTVDLFLYIFSGLDYVLAKTLIPILPMLSLCIAYYVVCLKGNYIGLLITVVITLIIVLVCYKDAQGYKYMMIDLIVIALASLLTVRFNPVFMLSTLVIPTLLIKPFYQIQINSPGNALGYGFLNMHMKPDPNGVINELIPETNPNYRVDMEYPPNALLGDKAFKNTYYNSIVNKESRDFQIYDLNLPYDQYHDIRYTPDPISNLIYSEKYTLKTGEFEYIPIGYHSVYESENLYAIKNDNVLPIAYVSYDNINYDTYENLDIQQKNDVLANYAIVNEGNKEYQPLLQPVNLNYQVDSVSDSLKFEQLPNGNIKVISNGGGDVSLNLSQPLTNQILLINFDVENIKDVKEKDVRIRINNESNIRSNESGVFVIYDNHFGYKVNSSEPVSNLNIGFSDGEYEIANVQVGLINYENLVNRSKAVTPLSLNSINQNKLVLDGNVNAKEDGYFVTSIPWQDNAFNIYVDGKKVKTEKVNNAFIGAKITKGEHNIVVKYNMPGKRLGTIVSVITLLGIISSPYVIRIVRQRSN